VSRDGDRAAVMAENTSVDRGNAVPLYHQIFLGLRDEIISGQRAFGASVPTEQALAGAFAVSRITARRALDELAQHGFVERRRRTGTRVIYRSPTRPIEANIDQAVESLLAFGRDTKVRVLQLATQPAPPEIAARLQITAGDPVIRAVRVRLLDHEPLGEVISHVPAALGLRLDRRDLTETPMLALLRDAGHAIGGGGQTISATVAGGHLAALLAIDLRAPILRIERTVLDTGGRPILFTVASYRADRYRIGIDLQMPGRPMLQAE
jgi:GntR family transcriptional regulator